MKKTLFLVIVIFISQFSFAHGEDKSGPNGGYVRMPGAFHTELVLDGKNKIKVYLLDMAWSNPSVVKSNLAVTLNKKAKAKCEIADNHYLCTFPDTVNLTKKGQLSVVAEREEQKGMEVTYKLPLKLEAIKSEHSNHH